MTIMVPKSAIEDFTTPRAAVFPEGSWRVTLEATRERPFPEFVADNVAAGKNSGYSSGDGETLGLQFGGASNIEDATQGTNQKLFVDIVTRDGHVTIDSGEPIPDASWQMQRSAALLAMLANAVGATEEVEGPNGTMLALADGFLDQLRSGDFTGQTFGVSVYHRPWKTATKSGTEVKVREIFQAV